MSAPRTSTLTPRQEALKLTLKQVSLPWAIYRRVSTKDQGEKYSPASQRETLLRLASDLDVSVPENFILLDKKTGKSDDRADYQQLMSLAKAKLIGGVLVLELSRVARNVTDAIEFRKMLKREGAALVFALQQFDDSPQGVLMFNQFAAFAEYEAALIIQRTSKGRLQKALEGKVADPHCFGYLYHPGVRLTGGKFREGYIEPHPVEADILKRMIFEAYAECGSVFRVQMQLNAAGILSKRGNPFSNTALRKILRNRIYTGRRVTTIKGEDLVPVVCELEIPALISQALYEKVQTLLGTHRDRAGRSPTTNLLSGLIRCSRLLPSGKPCQRRWTCHCKYAFSCSNRYDNRTRAKLCDGPQVGRRLIERLVLDGIRHHLRNPETTYRMAKAYHVAMARGAKAEVSVETRLSRLKDRYERTEAIIFANVPQRTRDKAAAQLREMEQERMALEVEARESAVLQMPRRDRVVETFERMQEGLDRIDTFEEKRELLLRTVRRIETDGREYAIHCRVKLGAAAAAGDDGQNRELDRGAVPHFDFVIRGRVA